jgi:GTP-binding protein
VAESTAPRAAHPLRQARFLFSAHRLAELPPDQGHEVAFAGRSNAGKSSALNALCDHAQLARVSRTPGRTQLMNAFEVGPNQRLIDLPGYGYAKVPAAMREHWQGELQRYFDRRESLSGLVLIVDIRHPLKEFDLQMLDYCEHRGLPCHVLLTKADKLGAAAQSSTLAQVRKALAQRAVSTSAQRFSALKKTGIDDARAVIASWLQLEVTAAAPAV